MQKTSRIKFLLLALLLFSGVNHAATGPETAQLLNQRYHNSAPQCAGANPAYFCSGVLLRGSEGTQAFWKHSANAVQLGAEGFNYLRADLDTRSLSQAYGAVFSDQFTAIGQDKALDVLCAYPFEFAVQGTRPDFGCGWTATVKAQDASSCTTQGATDVQSWLAHFAQQGNQPAKQCSLSTQDPAQFSASLVAHQRIGTEWSVQPTLLQIKNWDDQAPKQLPLQGLFYDVTKSGSLLGAQKDQRDYFNATGDWLPILRMDLSRKPDAVFGFNQQDQLYIGYQVAANLNARYANTTMTCPNNEAAYKCSGVLIRTTSATPEYHAWNSSPGSVERNGVSFSYLRADIYLPILAWSKPQGLILKELSAPAAYPLTLRCAWPHDAATFYRSDSCNESSRTPLPSHPCDEQGITTVEAYLTHFNALTDRYAGCSLKGEQAPFAVSIQVRALFSVQDQRVHNESIIADWPQNIPEKIPLQAFFYTSVLGKPSARYFQKDYFEQTAGYLPVVQLTFNAADNAYRFEFDPQDQLVGGETP
ncbi:hypothetical protein [Pseudomonas sp. B26(2017)]|uniref:hypothetical protein n=1 Tax=Pseudomonas sp. B26(2017) TaxID=1981732 RepID=UPI000A1FE61C|nr:hypothetical protein [Pseudomonas sp. B26(2017)]